MEPKISKTRTVFSWIAYLTIAVIVIIALIKLANILTFLMIFSWVVDALVTSLGMNIWLARLVSLVPTVVCVVALTYSLSFIPQFQKAFPFIKSNKQKRLIGNVTLVGCVLMFFTFMYVSETTKRFDPITGESKLCLALGANGYEEVSCLWEYHPTTGKKVVKDKKTLQRLYATNDPQAGSIDTVKFNKNIRLFSSEGSPLFWYHELPDGTIHLSNNPGNHPQLNVELKPIDKKIAARLISGKPEGKQKFFLLTTSKKQSPQDDLAKDFDEILGVPTLSWPYEVKMLTPTDRAKTNAESIAELRSRLNGQEAKDNSSLKDIADLDKRLKALKPRSKWRLKGIKERTGLSDKDIDEIRRQSKEQPNRSTWRLRPLIDSQPFRCGEIYPNPSDDKELANLTNCLQKESARLRRNLDTLKYRDAKQENALDVLNKVINENLEAIQSSP